MGVAPPFAVRFFLFAGFLSVVRIEERTGCCSSIRFQNKAEVTSMAYYLPKEIAFRLLDFLFRSWCHISWSFFSFF